MGRSFKLEPVSRVFLRDASGTLIEKDFHIAPRTKSIFMPADPPAAVLNECFRELGLWQRRRDERLARMRRRAYGIDNVKPVTDPPRARFEK